MRIDDRVFVHHPKLIGLDAGQVDYVDLEGALYEAALGATEITVLGGYYNSDRIVTLCRKVPRGQRGECRIRVAVGLEATALIPQTWRDMRGMRAKLLQASFRDVLVSVVTRSPVHFHTKLFRFLKTTNPVWFISSANPGSDRHELMIRLSGRHEALSAYIDAVFSSAQAVSREAPPTAEIRTPQDFFLTGVLCHKPPPTQLFTFDAFRFSPQERDRFTEILAGEAGVEHASPRTEGFGFGLVSALGIDDVDTEDAAEGVQQIQYRRSCVETVLGFWMPRAYATEIKLRVAGETARRSARLAAVAGALRSDAGRHRAVEAFEDHVRSMETLLDKHQIDAKPVNDREAALARFLASRTRALASAERRARLARVLTLTNMPDIWGDQFVAEDFETSFCEDLAYRFESNGMGAGRAVRSLARGLSLSNRPTAGEIMAELVSRLKSSGWTDEDWSTD